MADNVPVSRADGPGKHAAAPGADAVSGPAAGQVDPASWTREPWPPRPNSPGDIDQGTVVPPGIDGTGPQRNGQ